MRGAEIFQWFFKKTFCAMHGQEGGSIDVDDEIASRLMENFGAFILGRNIFGRCAALAQKLMEGSWGDRPTVPCGNVRPGALRTVSEVMKDGTTFHFGTRGIEEGLRFSKQAAGDKGVKIGDGISTVGQYLQAGLIDSLHFAITPV